MGADQNLDWRRLAHSALDWWQDAGVDTLVDEAPFAWLDQPDGDALPAANAHARVKVPETPPVPAAGAPLPATLKAFAEWRVGGEAPEAAWRGTSLVGAGAARAGLMILVDCPERGDRAALLEGECGALFDRMLAAIGRTRADVVLAAVCTKRPTTGRVPREIEARLGEIARHHLSLVAPATLLTLGDAATRAILGTNAAESRGRLHAVNHREGTSTRVVASHHPRVLLDRPALKAEAWGDLLLATEEQGS